MKKTKTTSRVTWKGLRYALLNATNRSFYLALAVMFGIAYVCFTYHQALFGTVLAALAGITLVLLIGSSLVEYNTAVAHNKFAMLSTWAQGAGSDDERARRWGLLSAFSLDDAWQHSNLEYDGPRYNVDGTLMGPGSGGLDVSGNIYGATDFMTSVYNNDTGSWCDPVSAYASPVSDFDVSDSSRID